MEARKRYHRRSVRWAGHDYAQAGAYFVTICTHGHVCLFGCVRDGAMVLSAAGEVVERCWRAIPGHFPLVELDAFVVMPNHVHGIIWIGADAGARHASPVPPPAGDADGGPQGVRGRANGPGRRSLGAIVGSYKSAVSRGVNAVFGIPGRSVWHRNYFDHVIRNDRQLGRIRRYIEANPGNWALDRENPDRRKGTA